MKIKIGNIPNCISTTKDFDIEGDFKNFISSNRHMFWIDHPNRNLDITLYIEKNTKEGKKIMSLIESKKWNNLSVYLYSIVYSKSDPIELTEAINKVYKSGIDEGKRVRSKEFKTLLGA